MSMMTKCGAMIEHSLQKRHYIIPIATVKIALYFILNLYGTYLDLMCY